MIARTLLLSAAACLFGAAALAAQETPGRGEATFKSVCSTCHSIHPPALQAPPMAHVARHYLASDTSRTAVIERLVSWVREPSAERSLLPPMARERWGLMPPLLLPEEQLRDVAAYVLTLAESAPEGDARGMRHGRGMRGGMMRGRGMMPGGGS